MYVIPTQPSVPEQEITIQILSATYRLHLLWNARASLWYLDVNASDGTPIVSGCAVVLGAFIGRATQQLPFAQGAFIAIDTSGSNQDAGLDDLGVRVQLVFAEVSDLLLARTGS